MPLTAVILAAGAGTRLGELGRRYSKPMVPVAGRPLLDWVRTPLRAAGVQRLVVVGHPSDEQLESFLRTAYPDAVLVPQPERKGIADALCHALPLVADAPAYLACACDSIFPPDDVARVIARGRRCVGAAVIGVMDMSSGATASRSAVRLTGQRVAEIIEKPRRGTALSNCAAMPLYWLPQSMAPYLESVAAIAGERFISTAINDFIAAGGVVEALRVRERIEITSAADVRRAEPRLARQS